MESDPKNRTAARLGGILLFALVSLLLAIDSAMKLLLMKPAVDANALLGFSQSATFEIGVCLAACLLAYMIPPIRLLGAILLTGYLGGAVAAHLRADSGLFETAFPVFVGALVWGALLLLNAESRTFPWLRAMR